MEFAVADAPVADGVGAGDDFAVRSRSALPPSVVGYGLAAAATAALLPTVFSSSVQSLTFTPKLAVLILVAAIGAVPLWRLARSSHVSWAARAAVGFLVVALISAVLSQAVNVGFFGLYDWGTGWLFWFGCAGAFALGAYLRPEQLSWLLGGIVFAASVNAAAAVYQVAAKPAGTFGLYQGQADGMLGNPIHLEAVLLGALALIAGRASIGRDRIAWWPLVLLVSAGLELTLERLAVPIIAVIVLASLVIYGLRRAAPFAVLSVVGYVGAYVSAGSGLGARVASSTSTTTYGTRFNIWKLALRSVVHHPLFGVGPGQAVSAIAPHMTASFAAHLGPGTLPADSHDFLIEVLATTGVLGLLAFVAWLGGATLKARGPFLACVIAMLAVELVEPLNVGVTPVALLALGAATVSVGARPVGFAALQGWWRGRKASNKENKEMPSASVAPGAPVAPEGSAGLGKAPAAGARSFGPSVLVTAVLVIVSLFVGVTMVVGDHYMLTSYDTAQPPAKIAAGRDANRLLPYWAESAQAVSEGYSFASNFANSGAGPVKEALAWDLKAAARFPADPILPANISALELQLGDRAAARKEDLRSLALDPWTYLALEGLGTIAKQERQWRASLSWYEKALIVAPVANNLHQLISSDEAHLRS